MVQAPLNSTPTRIALPRSLWVTWFISLMLLTFVGGTLLCFPAMAQAFWPWPLAPFNTRLLGAIYASAALPLIGYLLQPRLGYLRILLPTFTCFTTYLLLVSIGFSGSFLPRKSSAVWFFLYGADSFIGLYFCWRMRASLKPLNIQSGWSMLYRIQSITLLVMGLGLLFLPSVLGPLWAWPLDAFHARLYSSVLIASALATECLRDRASTLERLWFGLTQLCLGSLACLMTWLVDLQVNKLNWSSVSPWLWQGIFLSFGLVGGWIVLNELRGLSRGR